MKVYILFLYVISFLVLVSSYLHIDSNFYYLRQFYSGFQFNQRLLVTSIYVILITAFFIFYGLFLTEVKSKKINFVPFLKMIFPLCFLLVFSYPSMLSFDIFNYIATSKVLYFYGENPYIVMPIEFKNDPLLQFMHAPNKIALYGVGWIFLSGVPYILGFGNFLITLFAFKFFVGAFYFATIYLLWKITKNVYAISLFALNPLVVIETFVSGHNDIVMMFFALLSVYLLLRKRLIWSIVFLALSIFIKYAAVFIFPVYIYVFWKMFTKKKINRETIYILCFFMMFLIFFLSPFRDEMYPWYAIWFLIFIPFIWKKKTLVQLVISLTFGLSLRYIPFMYIGTHFWITPILKVLLTITPVIIMGIFILLRKRQWLRS